LKILTKNHEKMNRVKNQASLKRGRFCWAANLTKKLISSSMGGSNKSAAGVCWGGGKPVFDEKRIGVKRYYRKQILAKAGSATGKTELRRLRKKREYLSGTKTDLETGAGGELVLRKQKSDAKGTSSDGKKTRKNPDPLCRKGGRKTIAPQQRRSEGKAEPIKVNRGVKKKMSNNLMCADARRQGKTYKHPISNRISARKNK